MGTIAVILDYWGVAPGTRVHTHEAKSVDVEELVGTDEGVAEVG